MSCGLPPAPTSSRSSLLFHGRRDKPRASPPLAVGNVKTKEYGAAFHLGGVITDAVLESDPLIPANYFIDGVCAKCKRSPCPCLPHVRCQEAEYIYLNGELLPRAATATSTTATRPASAAQPERDHKFSNWGLHWIEEWVERLLSPGNGTILLALLKRA